MKCHVLASLHHFMRRHIFVSFKAKNYHNKQYGDATSHQRRHLNVLFKVDNIPLLMFISGEAQEVVKTCQ